MNKNLKAPILKLLAEGQNYAAICKELNCSKATISYHAKNNGMSKAANSETFNPKRIPTGYTGFISKDGITLYTCQYCSNIISSVRKKYCDSDCQREHRFEQGLIKKWTNAQRVVSWRQRLKLRAVEYKGGECEICSYDKCPQSLQFHHKDPAEKEFSLSTKGIARSWDRVKKELDKCSLVCANCHGEIHAGLHPEYLIP
jgi:hypothetical protein